MAFCKVCSHGLELNNSTGFYKKCLNCKNPKEYERRRKESSARSQIAHHGYIKWPIV